MARKKISKDSPEDIHFKPESEAGIKGSETHEPAFGFGGLIILGHCFYNFSN